ncbi:BRCA1-associated RING domain protein 1 [Plutella xylostella]|uniref:BRCA1-associated RING domain protein 1 n=1 Tax=Plutella xylostella TaxID=51655 RepID=UPI00203310EC|nr:BRCA1-associated RING domain protein 1 [Plutella xylostella]
MSSTKLSTFLRALENVKQDLTCGVCGELCNDAVTLSKCFHLICAEHFDGLKNCPTCNIALDGCKSFTDKDLASTISSTKVLDDMFKPYRTEKENVHSNSRGDNSAVSEQVKKRRAIKKKEVVDKPDIVVTEHSTEKASAKKTTQQSNKTDELTIKKVDSGKAASKATQENLNASVLSNISSSKLNKTVEKRNLKGETALHVACRLGKIDKVTELLNLAANPNTKDNAGWTPLHEVVQNGRLDLVKLLLQHNALLNVPGQGNETPLHEAIRYGHKDIVKELVINGADVNARNIKGECPKDLATGEMREVLDSAAENIVQTQSANVTHISAMHSEIDYDDIRVYCVSETRKAQSKLKLLAKHHSNLHIEVKFNKKVTHLIVDTEDDLTCIPTLDILHGITNELWILSSNWIMNSSEEKLESFDKYEVVGVGKDTFNGPKVARFNKYKQLPGLFNGCHFYLHNFTSKYEISKQIVLTKAVLSKLITDADGVVLRRVPNPESIPESEKLVPYHARKDGPLVECSHYIIFKDMYEPRYNMKHLKALPVGWLIECIEKYELCDP